MKTLFVLLVVSSISLLYAGGNADKEISQSGKDDIVKNLIKGMMSENPGLRTNSAEQVFKLIEQEYIERDYFKSAVFPLMKMLRKGETELERISAALSLYKIEDKRGIYYLRGSARFDESDKVRLISKNLYKNYHSLQGSLYFVDF